MPRTEDVRQGVSPGRPSEESRLISSAKPANQYFCLTMIVITHFITKGIEFTRHDAQHELIRQQTAVCNNFLSELTDIGSSELQHC